MKFNKIIEKLSEYKIGEPIKRSDVVTSGYSRCVLSYMVTSGYAVSCRNESIILIRDIRNLKTQSDVRRKRMNEKDLNKLTYHYWVDNWEKHTDVIPTFYGVMMYVDNLGIGAKFDISDIMTLFDGFIEPSVYWILNCMDRANIIDYDGGKFIKKSNDKKYYKLIDLSKASRNSSKTKRKSTSRYNHCNQNKKLSKVDLISKAKKAGLM